MNFKMHVVIALSLFAIVCVEITNSALILQLDASTLGLTNGQTVGTWGPAAAVGTPTYFTGSTPNGSPAVQLNGTDHFGQLPASQFIPSQSQDFIIAAVIRPTNIGAYHNVIDDDASNRPMLWIDPAFDYELNFAGGVNPSTGISLSGWDVVIADSRNNQLYVNSATVNGTGGGFVPYGSAAAFDLFNRDGNQTFQGLVAELRVYNDAATFGNDFATLFNELNNKWITATAVPEPSTYSLILTGLIILGIVRKKRNLDL